MAKNTAELILKITKKGDGAKEAQEEIGGLEKAAKVAGAALTSYIGVETARQIGQVTVELAKLGAKAQRTETAFRNISGGASAATANLEAMGRATRGAVSETEAMASANQLMQMGLAGNAAELEEVAGMAVRLGTAMGRDANQSMEEFALLLANQSIPRLDTFGISAGAVRTRINELRDANEGMTRETAFMTAVMEEGRKSMKRLGDQTEDNQLAFEQLEASVTDFRTAVGKELAPVIADVARDLNDLVETGEDSEAFFYLLRTAIRVAAQGGKVDLQLLKETADDAKDTFRDLNEETHEVTEGFEEFGGVQAGLKGKLRVTGDATEDATEANDDYIDSLRQTRAMDAYAQRLQGHADALGETASRYQTVEDRVSRLNTLISGPVGEANEQYAEQQADINEQIAEAEAKLAELRGEHGRVIRTNYDAAEAQDNLTIAQARAAQEQQDLQEAQDAYNEAVANGEGDILQYEGALAQARRSAANAQEGVEEWAGAVDGSSTAVVNNNEKISEWEGKLGDLKGELGELQEEHREKMNMIIFDMLEARLAADGWTTAEINMATTVAEEMGLIDEDSKTMVDNVLGYYQQWEDGTMSAEDVVLGMTGSVNQAMGTVFQSFEEFLVMFNNLPDEHVIHIRTELSDPSDTLGKSGKTTETGETGEFEQSGTPFFPGGLAMLGEGGPELARLPRGTEIFNATETRRIINNQQRYEGDTVYIQDKMAAQMYLHDKRMRRYERAERRL